MAYTIEDWIDEMNILKTDKRKRIDTAHNLEKAMAEFFEAQLADIIGGHFLTDKSSEDYRDELADLYMMYAASKDDWMQHRARRFADEIQNTTENAVQTSNKPDLTEKVMLGIPLYKSEVPKKIKDALSEERATRVAMNETNVIHNYLHHMELRKKQLTHTWDATLDEFTRPHHFDADGMTVPIDEPFVIAGERLMFPGDDSLGATAKNLINCRCIEL